MKISSKDLFDKFDLHDAGITNYKVSPDKLIIEFELAEYACEEHSLPFGAKIRCGFPNAVIGLFELTSDPNVVSYQVLSAVCEDGENVLGIQEHDFALKSFKYCEVRFRPDPIAEVEWT